MKITGALLWFLVVAQVAFCRASARDQVIPPGYRPAAGTDEIALWQEMTEYETRLRESPFLVRDPDINEYVKRVMCRTARDYCADIRVYVVRNAGFNASMAPNGMMQVWSGVFLRVQNEEELAAIFGHELAHYTYAHSLARARKASDYMALSTILASGIPPVGGAIKLDLRFAVGTLAGTWSALAYSRNQEHEADLAGVRAMADAVYDPGAAVKIWGDLAAEEQLIRSSADEPSLFLTTHPDVGVRLKRITKAVAEQYGDREISGQVDSSLVALLNAHYRTLMEDQADTHRHRQTDLLLVRHSAMGVDPRLIAFFKGEVLRQSDVPDSIDAAIASYEVATASMDRAVVAQANRNLGYLHVKKNEMPAAGRYFRMYLEQVPAAPDREIVQRYLDSRP